VVLTSSPAAFVGEDIEVGGRIAEAAVAVPAGDRDVCTVPEAAILSLLDYQTPLAVAREPLLGNSFDSRVVDGRSWPNCYILTYVSFVLLIILILCIGSFLIKNQKAVI
jgi:hypothetical protein